jgi:DNA ligase (NAD+)
MTKAELFPIPELCPACSGPTSIEGDFLYCRSKSCPARLSGAVKVWVRNLGLLHWGDAMIDALTDPDNPRISSVADLYRLSVEDLAGCCSGTKMARKCHSVLHSNKSVPLELVLASLNIPNFGTSTATDVVQAGYDTVGKVLSMDFRQLLEVPNVGEVTARQVMEGLQARRDLILDLDGVLDIREPSGGPLQGKTVCITGELSMPRKAVEKLIMDAGGSPKGTVSKTTSYLVTNNPDTTSSKMKKAQKYGVPVIDEAGLRGLLGLM